MRSDLKWIHDNGEEDDAAKRDGEDEEEREEQEVFDLLSAFI